VGHPAQELLMEYLGFERYMQGEEFAVEYLYGKGGTPGAGFALQYLYQTMADYMLDTIVPTNGNQFLSSQDGRSRGVFHMAESYRSLVFSGIFGAIYDTDDENNKANLMATFLDYLLARIPNLYPPVNIQGNPENGTVFWDNPIYFGISDDFQSYKIYLNDELVEENLTITAYQFQNLEIGNENTVGIQAIYAEGVSEIIEIPFTFIGLDADEDLSLGNELIGNYPNPFNPTTTISFSTTNSGDNTEITIYNQKGQKVKTLLNEKLTAGEHSIIWDGKTAENKRVASGIYFYKMSSGNYSSMKRMVLLK